MSGRSNAVRIAAIATVILAAFSIVTAAVVDAVITSRLAGQVDAQLDESLDAAASQWAEHRSLSGIREASDVDDSPSDVDDAPTLLWISEPGGRPQAIGSRRAALPASAVTGRTHTVELGGRPFRIASRQLDDGSRLTAGTSLSRVRHERAEMVAAEAVLAPFVWVGMFAIALIIGLRAIRPVEAMRQRQLEFTADASHELRTPLSVITAEADLASKGDRAPEYYRSSLERIRGELKRLNRIVEDMLWLARFDSSPPGSPAGAVDMASMAESCAARFQAMATLEGVSIDLQAEGAEVSLVEVDAQWVDRLFGVLVDNALRHAHSRVRIAVTSTRSQVSIAVEDDGTGIPESERDHIFNRFYRASNRPGGSGLGLAIADAVVSSSGGRWDVGASNLGGARLQVTYPRARPINT